MSSTPSSNTPRDFDYIVNLLGGKSVFTKPITTEQQAHDVVQRRLPARAMVELILHLPHVEERKVLQLFDISPRSYARRKAAPKTRLSLTESNNVWDLAKLLAKATRVLGSPEAAERWFLAPAIALNKQTPIDLIATSPGTELVSDLLTRMEYGIYT